MYTHIARGDHELDRKAGNPAWFPCRNAEGKVLKPVIRCNCGLLCGIALHHVHSDGHVTASFYHRRGTNAALGEDPDGCEWHVFLWLDGWTGEDFPPK